MRPEIKARMPSLLSNGTTASCPMNGMDTRAPRMCITCSWTDTTAANTFITRPTRSISGKRISWNDTATVCSTKRNSPKPLPCLRTRVAYLPDDYWGYYNLGAAYSMNKQPKESIASLETAVNKRMTELDYWQGDKNLNNVRMLDDFKTWWRKYFYQRNAG